MPLQIKSMTLAYGHHKCYPKDCPPYPQAREFPPFEDLCRKSSRQPSALKGGTFIDIAS